MFVCVCMYVCVSVLCMCLCVCVSMGLCVYVCVCMCGIHQRLATEYFLYLILDELKQDVMEGFCMSKWQS